MIASVVATLEHNSARRIQLLEAAATRSEFEVGHCDTAVNRIPMTIEVEDRHEMEGCTRWLGSQPGVLSVDVVFVHFEEDAAKE